MALEFRFPDVGEGIHEGVVVQWLVKAGDAVAVDQPFVKVETDKAVVDLPAPQAGVLLSQHFEKGATIHVGDVLATFGAPGEKAASGAKAASAAPSAPPAQTASRPAAPAPSSGNGKVLATPHTRALARKLGVDLTAVKATGKNGRITDDDVQRAATGAAAPPARPASTVPVQALPAAPEGKVEVTEAGPVERTPVSHLRKVIAQAMALSKHTSAHVTHVDEADVTDLMALYRQVKPKVEADGVTKFSLMPLFMKAAALTLKAHPLFNASYDEARGEIVIKRYVHLGVAVDTPEGLIVPVVRDVDKKDMVTLAREMQDLAARARERRLSLEELRGASFTVTNIGAIGGVAATPIIHQPELAILGLFAIKDRPAVVDRQVVPRKLMNVAVTFDHRVIDGAQGARFARDYIQLLENPGLLMVRL